MLLHILYEVKQYVIYLTNCRQRQVYLAWSEKLYDMIQFTRNNQIRIVSLHTLIYLTNFRQPHVDRVWSEILFEMIQFTPTNWMRIVSLHTLFQLTHYVLSVTMLLLVDINIVWFHTLIEMIQLICYNLCEFIHCMKWTNTSVHEKI